MNDACASTCPLGNLNLKEQGAEVPRLESQHTRKFQCSLSLSLYRKILNNNELHKNISILPPSHFSWWYCGRLRHVGGMCVHTEMYIYANI